MHDKNISPVSWYICSYLLRFIEVNDPSNDDPETKFLSWENTILIAADSMQQAYAKAVAIAQLATVPYKGGKAGIDVQWIFEGITEILPVYEELKDGAEIMWLERKPTKLKNLRKLMM